MDDQQLGALARAVRVRRGLRQEDVAHAAGVSHGSVSLVERGHWNRMSIETVRRIAAVLDVRVSVAGQYRGGDAQRLLSRRHSLLASSFSAFAARLPGWVFEPEISFAVYGEKGVVDQLGWHAASAHLLVVELKTEFADVNEMLGTLDRKLRLARTIALERGWRPVLVSAWLVVLDTRTNRRQAAEHAALLRARFGVQGGDRFREFLSEPDSSLLGMSFWTYSNRGSTSQSQAVQRVRKRGPKPPAAHQDAPQLPISPPNQPSTSPRTNRQSRSPD